MAADVGILAVYNYFPPYVVQQTDLEVEDGVPGKYTTGLGQEELCFCSDREDPVSMALTAAVRLVEQHGVNCSEIGRIEVGSEGGVDRSKSIKSYLCQHFAAQGNTSIEGADSMHGCYGGTAALLNSVNWVESRSWDGRLALVVASDVAIYAPCSAARPTGGCGATAMLVGPNAPLQLLPPPWRATHSIHCFDFHKPHSSPLYPVVDGPLTSTMFLAAIDACAALLHARLVAAGELSSSGSLLPLFAAFVCHAPFNKMVRKAFSRLVLQDMLRASWTDSQQHGPENGLPTTFTPADAAPCPLQQASGSTAATAAGSILNSTHNSASSSSPPSAAAAAAAAAAPSAAAPSSAGAPPAALTPSVSAGTLRLEHLMHHGDQHPSHPSGWSPDATTTTAAAGLPTSVAAAMHELDPCALPDSSRCDKALERALLAVSEPMYNEKVADSTWLQKRCGNQYTASVYGGLSALLERRTPEALLGKKLLLFSFGSGAVASLLVLRVAAGSGRFTMLAMHEKSNLQVRLAERTPATTNDYATASEAYIKAYSTAPYQPCGNVKDLAPRTAYLDRVDEQHRRWYAWTTGVQQGCLQQQQQQPQP